MRADDSFSEINARAKKKKKVKADWLADLASYLAIMLRKTLMLPSHPSQ